MNKYSNPLKLRNLLAYIAVLVMLSSCGFIDDDPVDASDFKGTDGLSSNCKIDVDRIKKLFEEDISKDLNCVKDTLNLFKYVESRDKRYFFREDIVVFVRKYMDEPAGSAEDIIDGLDLLFKLNTLLLRDIPGQMSRSKIESFFAVLKEFNRSAIKIVDSVKKLQSAKTNKEYTIISTQLRSDSDEFANNINRILSDIPGPPQAIDIQELILDITKDLKDFKLGKELLNSLLFAKKLFLGGSRIYIDSDEFAQLFSFLPVFLQNTLDIFFLKKEFFEDGSEYFNKLANNLEELKLYVYEHQREETIITIHDINNIIDEFFNNEDDIIANILGTNKDTNQKLKSLIKFAKRDLIRGNPEVFSYSDVELSLGLINVGLRSFESVNVLSELLKDIDEKDFNEKVGVIKKQFRAEITNLSTNAIKLLDEDISIPRDLEMNILQFANDVSKLYDLDLSEEVVQSMLALKVVTTGGTRETLKFPELLEILKKTDPLAALFFDLKYLSKDYLEKSSLEKNYFFLAQVRSVQDLLLDELDNDKVITITDINNIIEQFFSKPEDLNKGIALKNIVANYKDNILKLDPSIEHLSFTQFKSTANVVAIVYRYLAFLDMHIENTKLFKNDDKPTTARKVISREDYIKQFLSIKVELQNYLLDPQFLNQDALIKSFIARLKESQDLFKNGFNWKLYSEAMHLKGLVLGGNNLILNRDNLYYFAEKSETLAEVLYDAFFTDFKGEDSVKSNATALDLVRKTRSILYPTQERTDYFTTKEILSFGDEVIKELNRKSDEPKDESELIKLSNFKRTIIDFAQRIFDPVPRSQLMYPIPCKKNPAHNEDSKQGVPKWICSEENPPGSENFDLVINSIALNNILDLAEGAVETLLFSDATYNFFEERLKSTEAVYIDAREYPTNEEVPEYKLIRKKSYVDLIQEFSRVARDYRYFRDEDGFPTYQADIVRNKTGFNSIMLFRNVLPYVLEGYRTEGDTTNPRDSKGLADNQLNNALVGLKAVLEEMGLWTDDFKTFGENILLLSDLFQATSNGDLGINLDETSEFIELIFTAAKITNLMEENLYKEDLCEYRTDDEGFRVMKSTCIRGKFFEKLFGEKELNLSKYFPRLSDYNNSNSKALMIEFIKGVEIFSRSVEDVDAIWWRKKDFTLVIGAMLNIESTFIRYDQNTDNKLDRRELDHGYKTSYELAIVSIAGLKGKLTTLGRTAFFYLLKYHKDPGAINILWTHVWFKKYFNDFEARRLDISELLKFLVDKRKPENPSLMFKEELAACSLGRTDMGEDELNDLFSGMSIEIIEEEIRQCHADYVQSTGSETFYGNIH